jgi:hypothetical protein
MGVFSTITNLVAPPPAPSTELPVTTTPAACSGAGAAAAAAAPSASAAATPAAAAAAAASSSAPAAAPKQEGKWFRTATAPPATAAQGGSSTAITIPPGAAAAASASGTAAAAAAAPAPPPPKHVKGKWLRTSSDPLATAPSGGSTPGHPDKAPLSAEEAAFEARYAHCTAAERRKIKHLDALSHTLDAKFKVGPVKVGYDSIIGVVPVAGDAFGAAMGTYLIGNALQLGMPKRLVARMMLNVALDTAVGVIPFVGDVFDIAHKSNSRNIALLKKHMDTPRRATAADTCFLCGAFFCVVVFPCLLFLGFLAGVIILILWLCRAIFQ